MCWDCYDHPEGDPYKNFKRGGVEVEDFDDDLRYRHPKRRAKKARARPLTRKPCPATEDGKHVYVWNGYISEWSGTDKIFLEHFGYHRTEILTCCGCYATKGWSRETERYMKAKERKWRKLTGGEFAVKRGAPVERYRYGGSFHSFSWEMRVPEYAEKVKAYEKKRRLAWEAYRVLR